MIADLEYKIHIRKEDSNHMYKIVKGQNYELHKNNMIRHKWVDCSTTDNSRFFIDYESKTRNEKEYYCERCDAELLIRGLHAYYKPGIIKAKFECMGEEERAVWDVLT